MKSMPALGAKCITSFNQSLDIVSATETLWLTAPPASAVRKQLKTVQLEALYEATFLRIFAAYESFLEKCLIHFMAKYSTLYYIPSASSPGSLCNSLKDAESTLFAGRKYLLWHNPESAIKRSRKFLVDCPIETVLESRKILMEDYATIRHHIAHNSTDTKMQFSESANRLTGNSHRGRAGKLLRSENISDPLNQTKWIRMISDDMADAVLEMCP